MGAVSHLTADSILRRARVGDVTIIQTGGIPESMAALMSGNVDFVRGIAFDPTGQLIASGDQDATVRLWDVGVLQPLGKPLILHSDMVTGLAIGLFTGAGTAALTELAPHGETRKAATHAATHKEGEVTSARTAR